MLSFIWGIFYCRFFSNNRSFSWSLELPPVHFPNWTGSLVTHLPPTLPKATYLPYFKGGILPERQAFKGLSLQGMTLDFSKQWSGRTGSYLQLSRPYLRNNRLTFKTAGKLPIILKEYILNIPQFSKGNSKAVNMWPFGHGNTRIWLTCYAQKSPRTSDQGDFWGIISWDPSVCFASPSGWLHVDIFWFGFPILIWGTIYSINSSKVIGNSSAAVLMNFNQ